MTTHVTHLIDTAAYYTNALEDLIIEASYYAKADDVIRNLDSAADLLRSLQGHLYLARDLTPHV